MTDNKIESKAAINTGNKIHSILCVDDEPSLVTLLKEVLEMQGYRVTTFTESKLALSHFKAHPQQYDLVISDQTMPQLTGIEMATAMLEIQPDIPIILCSGYNDHTDKTAAESIGIRAYMQKPVDMKTLINTIKQLSTQGAAS